MNNASFRESFRFRQYIYESSHNWDRRKDGAPYHYLAYLENGYAKLVSAEKKLVVELSPGDVCYIPKGIHYQSFWHANDQVVVHSYGFSFLPDHNHKRYPMQKIALTSALAEQVHNIPLAHPVDCAAIGALYTTLAAILPLMETTPLNSKAILCDKATRYMTRHPNATVSDIARHYSVSESAIYNAFRHVLGITPNTQRQNLLCDRAIELLTTTDRPIEEISDALGFSSSSYFRKVLFSRTGQTPSEVRKKVLFRHNFMSFSAEYFVFVQNITSFFQESPLAGFYDMMYNVFYILHMRRIFL